MNTACLSSKGPTTTPANVRANPWLNKADRVGFERAEHGSGRNGAVKGDVILFAGILKHHGPLVL